MSFTTVNSTRSPVGRSPAPPPSWPLRSEAAELRALVIAARHRVSVHQARVLDELRVGPARRA